MSADDMTEHDHRLMAAGELAMLDYLLPFIADEALLAVRWRLRQPGEWPGMSPAQRVMHAGLLDEVCRRFVAFGGPADYFIGVGDMRPQTPDDLSSMPESGVD
jgi:hypothetical protein